MYHTIQTHVNFIYTRKVIVRARSQVCKDEINTVTVERLIFFLTLQEAGVSEGEPVQRFNTS